MKLGNQAAIRERIVIEAILDYVNNERNSDDKIFSLREVKRRVNLYDQQIEVALGDLRTQGVIEVAPAYTQTDTPMFQFTEQYLEKGEAVLKISTQWMPGQGWHKQRGDYSKPDPMGWVQWCGEHRNLQFKHYNMT